jgi:hypothetical protein
MHQSNTTQQIRKVPATTAIGASKASDGAGFVEIAILSLAGVTLSLLLIAHGLLPDGLALILAQ